MPKYVNGDEVLLVDRVPDPQLGRDPPIEVAENIEAVGTFGRRGEAEQLAGRTCSSSARYDGAAA